MTPASWPGTARRMCSVSDGGAGDLGGIGTDPGAAPLPRLRRGRRPFGRSAGMGWRRGRRPGGPVLHTELPLRPGGCGSGETPLWVFSSLCASKTWRSTWWLRCKISLNCTLPYFSACFVLVKWKAKWHWGWFQMSNFSFGGCCVLIACSALCSSAKWIFPAQILKVMGKRRQSIRIFSLWEVLLWTVLDLSPVQSRLNLADTLQKLLCSNGSKFTTTLTLN